MTPSAFMNGLKSGCSAYWESTTNRTGRSRLAIKSKPSMNDTWLGTSSAPPDFGTCVLADDAEAVQGIGQDDQHQTDECIREKPKRPQHAGHRHAGAGQENTGGRKTDVGQRTTGERSQ